MKSQTESRSQGGLEEFLQVMGLIARGVLNGAETFQRWWRLRVCVIAQDDWQRQHQRWILRRRRTFRPRCWQRRTCRPRCRQRRTCRPRCRQQGPHRDFDRRWRTRPIKWHWSVSIKQDAHAGSMCNTQSTFRNSSPALAITSELTKLPAFRFFTSPRSRWNAVFLAARTFGSYERTKGSVPHHLVRACLVSQ